MSNSSNSSKIQFGTDGWRGIIADDFTFANVRKVTRAIASYLQTTYSRKCPVLIAYDTGFLADEFAYTAALVLAGLGWTVKIAKQDCPTPAIAYEGKPLSRIVTEAIKEAGSPVYNQRLDLHLSANQKTTVLEALNHNPPKEIAGIKVKKVGHKDGIKLYLENGSWVLLRPSGTDQKTLFERNVPVELLLGAKVSAVHPERIEFQRATEQSESISTATVVWTAGLTALPIIKELPISDDKRDRQGRLHVTPTLQLLDFPEVFAGGDCAAVLDNPLPPTAQVAYQQGYAIAVIVMNFISSSLSWVQSNLIAHFAQRLQLGLVLEFGRAILRLPLSYYEARRSGEIVSRLRDIEQINQLVAQ